MKLKAYSSNKKLIFFLIFLLLIETAYLLIVIHERNSLADAYSDYLCKVEVYIEKNSTDYFFNKENYDCSYIENDTEYRLGNIAVILDSGFSKP